MGVWMSSAHRRTCRRTSPGSSVSSSSPSTRVVCAAVPLWPPNLMPAIPTPPPPPPPLPLRWALSDHGQRPSGKPMLDSISRAATSGSARRRLTAVHRDPHLHVQSTVSREVQRCTDWTLASPRHCSGRQERQCRLQRTATPLHAATACSCARCPPVSRLLEASRAPVSALRPALLSPAALALRVLMSRAPASPVTARQPRPSRPRMHPSVSVPERGRLGRGHRRCRGMTGTEKALRDCYVAA